MDKIKKGSVKNTKKLNTDVSKNIHKYRCPYCLNDYKVKKGVCPVCGGGERAGGAKAGISALPPFTRVCDYTIGGVIASDSRSITYIAIRTDTKKHFFIKELFIQGYMMRSAALPYWKRNEEDTDCPYPPLSMTDVLVFLQEYSQSIQYMKKEFSENERNVFEANNTLYSVYKYDAKKVKKRFKSTAKNYSIEQRSYIGRRESQEDAALFEKYDNGIFAILCDGMGGLSGGELASNECVLNMRRVADALCICDEPLIRDIYIKQINDTNRRVYGISDSRGALLGCGTTMVSVVVRGDLLYYASVGDSHIYIIHNNNIILLNEEHNVLSELQRMESEGRVSHEYVKNYPNKAGLTSYIGVETMRKIDLFKSPICLEAGDVVVLCSDGLYRTINDDNIMSIINANSSVADAADKLVETAKYIDNVKQDNLTFIIYRHEC